MRFSQTNCLLGKRRSLPDIDSLQFEEIFSLGFEDHGRAAVDPNKSDGKYDPKTCENIFGIRMPDGISAAVINGETYLPTANEGDSRAWQAGSETDTNEIKNKTSPVNGIRTGGKVTWLTRISTTAWRQEWIISSADAPLRWFRSRQATMINLRPRSRRTGSRRRNL